MEIIEDSEERIGFISNAQEGIPQLFDSDGEATDTYLDDDARIPRCLAEGEVLVIMEVGREEMRYLKGYAVAINWDGKVCHVSLDEISAHTCWAINISVRRQTFAVTTQTNHQLER